MVVPYFTTEEAVSFFLNVVKIFPTLTYERLHLSANSWMVVISTVWNLFISTFLGSIGLGFLGGSGFSARRGELVVGLNTIGIHIGPIVPEIKNYALKAERS